jgi:hypothetical protein
MTVPTYHGVQQGENATLITAGNPANIPLPGSVQLGSLLIAFLNNGTAEIPSSGLAGWTEYYSVSSSCWRAVYMKIATADDVTASAGAWNLPLINATNARYSYVTFEVRGWYGSVLDASTISWVTPNTYTGAQGFPQASPANNPSGWDVEDTLWLAAYMCDGINALTTAPTDYTVVGAHYSVQASGATTAVFGRGYTAGAGVASETPGPWTMTTQKVSSILTIGIRPAAAGGLVKKLKVQVHPSAASATGIEGVVYQSSAGIAGPEIGEFTGKAFEATTEGAGETERAILKVPVTDFGGGSLAVNDTVAVCVRNTLNTTGIIPGTVIEE